MRGKKKNVPSSSPSSWTPSSRAAKPRAALAKPQGARYSEQVGGTAQSLCGELLAVTFHNTPGANAASSHAPAAFGDTLVTEAGCCSAHFQAEQHAAKDAGSPFKRTQPPDREERRVLMDQLRQNSREGNKRPSNIGLSQISSAALQAAQHGAHTSVQPLCEASRDVAPRGQEQKGHHSSCEEQPQATTEYHPWTRH